MSGPFLWDEVHSLFRSNEELSDFIEYYRSIIQIYSLQPWDYQARRVHAWVHLENRKPKAGENDSPAISSYLRLLDSNKTLAKVSATPFYADLLLRIYAEGPGSVPSQEKELVELALDSMCQREYEKGTISRGVFPPNKFMEWLEELATLSYKTGGVSIEDLRGLAELAEVLASRELTEEEKTALIDHISMAPFLTRSSVSGKIEFTHEIFAEYLAARTFIKEFRTIPTKFASRLSQKDWAFDSIFFPC